MQDFKTKQRITEAGTTYSAEFDYSDSDNLSNLEAFLNVTAHSEGDATLDITPQISYDGGETWVNGVTVFDKATSTIQQILKLVTLGLKMRFQIVVEGTEPVIEFTIFAVAR